MSQQSANSDKIHCQCKLNLFKLTGQYSETDSLTKNILPPTRKKAFPARQFLTLA